MQPDFLFFGFRSLLASFLYVVFPKKKKELQGIWNSLKFVY